MYNNNNNVKSFSTSKSHAYKTLLVQKSISTIICMFLLQLNVFCCSLDMLLQWKTRSLLSNGLEIKRVTEHLVINRNYVTGNLTTLNILNY